jgi:hypothetical protein
MLTNDNYKEDLRRSSPHFTPSAILLPPSTSRFSCTSAAHMAGMEPSLRRNWALASPRMASCGTPLGAPAFVAPCVERQVDQVCALTDALLVLPLATQDEYLLLHWSLQRHMAQCLCTIHWELLHMPVSALEAKLADAAICLTSTDA